MSIYSIPCQECKHSTAFHFFEADYPDYGFCMMYDCNCACDWIRIQAQGENTQEN